MSENPFSPCGRRWPAGPDEGSRRKALVGGVGAGDVDFAPTPHPAASGDTFPRKGEKGPSVKLRMQTISSERKTECP